MVRKNNTKMKKKPRKTIQKSRNMKGSGRRDTTHKRTPRQRPWVHTTVVNPTKKPGPHGSSRRRRHAPGRQRSRHARDTSDESDDPIPSRGLRSAGRQRDRYAPARESGSRGSSRQSERHAPARESGSRGSSRRRREHGSRGSRREREDVLRVTTRNMGAPPSRRGVEEYNRKQEQRIKQQKAEARKYHKELADHKRAMKQRGEPARKWETLQKKMNKDEKRAWQNVLRRITNPNKERSIFDPFTKERVMVDTDACDFLEDKYSEEREKLETKLDDPYHWRVYKGRVDFINTYMKKLQREREEGTPVYLEVNMEELYDIGFNSILAEIYEEDPNKKSLLSPTQTEDRCIVIWDATAVVAKRVDLSYDEAQTFFSADERDQGLPGATELRTELHKRFVRWMKPWGDAVVNRANAYTENRDREYESRPNRKPHEYSSNIKGVRQLRGERRDFAPKTIKSHNVAMYGYTGQPPSRRHRAPAQPAAKQSHPEHRAAEWWTAMDEYSPHRNPPYRNRHKERTEAWPAPAQRRSRRSRKLSFGVDS